VMRIQLKKPLLCRLGFHKWRNYGEEVEVFYSEERSHGAREMPLRTRPIHGEAVYEKRKCKRCGMKLRRTLVTNPDGTLSCVGWEADTEETDEE
jgi:hypothetical protein